MKKLLNTLYITTPESYLSKDGTNVVVSRDGKEVFRIPIQNLQSIITFGYQGASPGVMKLCTENGVDLSFYTPQGTYIARIQGRVNGNVLLRCEQHNVFRDINCATHLAGITISAKIYNSRVTLRRFVRDYPERAHKSDIVPIVAEKLKQYYRLARQGNDINEIRGIEGDAAARYFKAFPELILNDSPEFSFNGRVRRPPTDIVNALLSFGYSLLAGDCASALEGVGLDPAVGFLHTLRPGRNSLALDLMEEFRSYLVDRFVLTLINNRQISKNDFISHGKISDNAPIPVLLTDRGRATFLAAWQNRKKSEITHPFLGEKVPLGLLPHIQAQLLARFLRGDIDDYPGFLAN